ncbi:FMN-binding negative transcriptional regulator [Methylomonas paludis]|uniref:FMN-binding negative transcriptional regulator n=1 Tax=Methylomonas paludis TaxID=1173101 RepID=A0A975RB14_9GAMM|nr:FMN-binding negative transcriptional regulator [Methylomonas paludis]QWF71811.1 FMN-binding negative transcriptional regulator [Methylomonas paludis]
MYIPSQFDQPNVEVMHELMRNRPLATLVTVGSDGINANHIPLHLLASALPYGVLRGHVARSNPVWRDFAADKQVLAIFHGPEAYISPSWYITKHETGRVVPTWNYTVVHAYGSLRIVDDAAWIRTQLEALTNHNEAALSKPWAVSDAPNDFTEKLIEAIVGIEITITKLSGKWKVSQNQPLPNRISVAQALNTIEQGKSAEMAVLVNSRIDKQQDNDGTSLS